MNSCIARIIQTRGNPISGEIKKKSNLDEIEKKFGYLDVFREESLLVPSEDHRRRVKWAAILDIRRCFSLGTAVRGRETYNPRCRGSC